MLRFIGFFKKGGHIKKMLLLLLGVVDKVLRDFIKTCQRKSCRDEGGANLSSIFTIDKDNMPRPAVAGWSLGAYQVIMPNAPTSLQIQ